MTTDPTAHRHCCATRLLGRDPRLWICEHCGLFLRDTAGGLVPAPAEWVAESYPAGVDRPQPQDRNYEKHNRFGALGVGGLTRVEG